MKHQRRNNRVLRVRFAAALLRMSVFTVLFSSISFPVEAQTSEVETAASSSADAASEVPVMDSGVFKHVLFEQLEGRADGSSNELRWDGEVWAGTDTNRLWLKSEGFSNGSTVSEGDVEALYDRPLPRVRYFDAQIGVREDVDSGPHRTWAAVGIEGLAPEFFEIEPTFYFRGGGHVAGRITTLYNLLLTQRLIAQPEIELNFYNKDDVERRVGSGLSDLDTGVRVRYEISRKFAPYLGFAYTKAFGRTAVLSHQNGESIAGPQLTLGFRFWY